jgi:uncharacterized membrane protein
MMSQNRQEQRERLRGEHDFRTNLRAEIEIRNLNEKVDRLLAHQWERLEELRQMHDDLHRRLGGNGKASATAAPDLPAK